MRSGGEALLSVFLCEIGDELGERAATFDGERVEDGSAQAARFAVAAQADHLIGFGLRDETCIEFGIW